MKKEELLIETRYIEDELGVYVYNLTAAELKTIAEVCHALALLTEDDREDLYSELNPDYVEENLYDDDNEGELN